MINLFDLRYCLGVLLVCNDDVTRVEQRGIQSASRKCCRTDLARKPLAVADYVIRGPWSEFADCHNAPQQLVESIEFLLQLRMELREDARPQQFSRRRIVALAQCS